MSHRRDRQGIIEGETGARRDRAVRRLSCPGRACYTTNAGDIDFKGRMGTKKRKADAVTGDPAFEQWVGRQLHKMYDEVLAEDIPADLLRLVDRLAERGADAPAEDAVKDDDAPTAATGRRRPD
jgi:hypothetical protein